MVKGFLFTLFGIALLCSCAKDSNEGSSEPINQQEALLYKQALFRCYKTGGSRIVKINGTLQCY